MKHKYINRRIAIMKNTKWMKEMTSAELAEAIKNGTDTVIIPGGAY